MFSIFYVFRIKWKRWSVAKADLPNLGKKPIFCFLFVVLYWAAIYQFAKIFSALISFFH